jgi:hypothetical protein
MGRTPAIASLTGRCGALFLALLLAGCAGREWVRPGFSDAQNAQDRAACREAADSAYAAGYAAERSQNYDGGLRPLDSPLEGLPRRYGRGDLVASEDASRRLDRDINRSETELARDDAEARCLEQAGFRLSPPQKG